MFRQIAHNSLIQISGKVISTALGLLIVSLMTRGLGAAGFGQYVSVVAYLQFFGILVDFGLTMTLARELGRGEFASETVAGNAFSFRSLTAGGAFILAPIVAWLLPYAVEIKIAITLTSLAFWATSVQQSLVGLFQYKLATWSLTIVEILSRMLLLLGTWWLSRQQSDFQAYLYWLTIINIITLISTYLAARQLIHFRWTINKPVWHKLWQATWPITVTIILNLFYFKADTIILSWYKTAAEVGLYGAAYKVLEVLLALPAIVGGLVLPWAARAYARQDKSQIQKIYSGTFDTMLAAGLVVIIGSWLLGVPVITWLAGTDFAIAGRLVGILGLATALIFIGNATGYIIFALDQQKKMIPYYAAAALIGLAGYFIFIPSYSYWGAAWMTVVVEFFMAAVGFTVLWRQQLRPSPARWPKILLLTLLSGTILLYAWPWPIKITLAAAVYLILLKLFKLWPRGLTAKTDLEY
ncbi:MAG: flippase [Candidatus Kerfeldbacteria bacterium]|nr:flippase [Candidatus Kerfeldbacteria bacterium]